MSTIGDLVNGNPYYEKGVFLDGSYYKNWIPQSRFSEAAPSAFAQRIALIQTRASAIFQELTTIGCLVAPALYVLGSTAAFPGIIAATILAITMHDLDNKNDPSHEAWTRRTTLQSQLVAMLPEGEKRKYFLRQFGWDLAFKVAMMGLIVLSPAGNFFSHMTLFGATFHYVREVENMVLLAVRCYVERNIVHQRPAAVPLAAPAVAAGA